MKGQACQTVNFQWSYHLMWLKENATVCSCCLGHVKWKTLEKTQEKLITGFLLCWKCCFKFTSKWWVICNIFKCRKFLHHISLHISAFPLVDYFLYFQQKLNAIFSWTFCLILFTMWSLSILFSSCMHPFKMKCFLLSGEVLLTANRKALGFTEQFPLSKMYKINTFNPIILPMQFAKGSSTFCNDGTFSSRQREDHGSEVQREDGDGKELLFLPTQETERKNTMRG